MADDKTYLALADEHQWKSFNDLSQIGITAGSETIMDIIVAMPEGSDLSYEIRASQHNHDAYPYPTGTITIKKYSDSACDIEHVCSANNEYRGTWRMYAVGSANTFILSDWIQVYDAVNPPEKISRESITPFTVDNAEEGSTQSFINFSTGGSVNGGIGFYGLLPYIVDDEGNLLGKIYHAGDKPTASDVGAVPRDGSLPMTGGTLRFKGTNAWIDTSVHNTSYNHSTGEGDINERTYLQVSHEYELNDAVILARVSGGNGAVYSILGTHNYKNYVLPLDGSVAMTGQRLELYNGNGFFNTSTTNMQICIRNTPNDDSNMRILTLSHSGNVSLAKSLQLKDFIDSVNENYIVFGEHNKPSGTYSGNGGSQTINTGGLGDAVLVQLTGSGGGFALVTKSGAIGKLNSNNSVFALADTEAKFIGGVLTLNSSNYGVNRSGYGYNWQVL